MTPTPLASPPPPAPSIHAPGDRVNRRYEQVFVDLVAHDAMEVLQRVIFVGTGAGRAALSLARAASHKCQLVTYDEHDDRLEEVKGEWETLKKAATAVVRPILESGKALVDELLAEDYRAPLLVISNWVEGEDLFAEEVLSGIAPHLPDSSVVVVPRRAWEDYSGGPEVVEMSVRDGIASTISVDERFVRPALEMMVDLVALKVEHDQLPHFDRSLLPSWTGLGQVALQSPLRRSRDEWIVFARLQKTASKTIEGYLQSNSRRTRCGRRFLVSPPFDNRYCSSNELCSPENVVGVMNDQNGYCHVMSGHHCDWDDLMRGLFQYRPEEMRLLTGVREPTARVKSEFKHVHGSHLKAWDYCPSAEGGPNDKFARQTFIEFFRKEQNAWGMANRQTRMLAGCGTTERCSLTDAELLERAKQHALQAHVITVAERLSESVLLTAYVFGWEVNEFPIVSDSRVMEETLHWDIDEELASIILQKNNEDARLVEFCNAVMDSRITEFKKRLATEELPNLVCVEDVCRLERAELIQWEAFVPSNPP